MLKSTFFLNKYEVAEIQAKVNAAQATVNFCNEALAAGDLDTAKSKINEIFYTKEVARTASHTFRVNRAASILRVVFLVGILASISLLVSGNVAAAKTCGLYAICFGLFPVFLSIYKGMHTRTAIATYGQRREAFTSQVLANSKI